jgi:hypothetical protein
MTRMESGRQSDSAARVAQRVAKTDDENDEDEGPANDPPTREPPSLKLRRARGYGAPSANGRENLNQKENHSR